MTRFKAPRKNASLKAVAEAVGKFSDQLKWRVLKAKQASDGRMLTYDERMRLDLFWEEFLDVSEISEHLNRLVGGVK